MECNWDGGDCCGDNVNTQYCSHCDCLNGDVKVCTAENPCGHNEGDCNYDNDCQPGLKCGQGNCPAFLGYDQSIDCCRKPINGDENFCTAENLCGLDEGDCDYDNECQPGLKCGTDNCPTYLGYHQSIDCCTWTG